MSNIYIDKTARIADTAIIGAGSKIWMNAQVRERAVIGSNCIVSKDVYIDQDVAIGDGCKIQNGANLYKGLTVGSDVFIGPNVTFTNDKIPRAFNTDWVITPTKIEDGASIGAAAVIVCGITVGAYAMVAAGSVVTRDVPSYTLVMGNPARVVSQIDKAGNRIKDGAS